MATHFTMKKKHHFLVWCIKALSQVVASAPKAFEKLDQKRQTLNKLKGVLAQKLEDKQKQKEKKLLKTKLRSASAMMVERPESRQSQASQERCASAMTVLKSSNYGNTIAGLLSFLLNALYIVYTASSRPKILREKTHIYIKMTCLPNP